MVELGVTLGAFGVEDGPTLLHVVFDNDCSNPNVTYRCHSWSPSGVLSLPF